MQISPGKEERAQVSVASAATHPQSEKQWRFPGHPGLTCVRYSPEQRPRCASLFFFFVYRRISTYRTVFCTYWESSTSSGPWLVLCLFGVCQHVCFFCALWFTHTHTHTHTHKRHLLHPSARTYPAGGSPLCAMSISCPRSPGCATSCKSATTWPGKHTWDFF